MGNVLKILFLLLVLENGQAHSLSDTTKTVKRLYHEVKEYHSVESKYIGCHGSESALYLKVDSLVNLLGQDSFIQYFEDASYVLKFYAYQEILVKSDSLAFVKLVDNINDTTFVQFGYRAQYDESMKFNEILAVEYAYFLRLKYYEGGFVVIDGHVHRFGKKNHRMWRAKNKAFLTLLEKYHMKEKIVDILRLKC
jgi:hypothetical protein